MSGILRMSWVMSPPPRCPWLSDDLSSVIPFYIAVVFLFTLANFCMATFMDPGVFPRGMYARTHARTQVYLAHAHTHTRTSTHTHTHTPMHTY